MRKFLRSYSFIIQMISLGDEDLHRFVVYAGFLVKKLFLETGETSDLRGKVELGCLRIEDKGTKSISLESEQLHNGGANTDVSKDEKVELLSVLIDHLNATFGTEWYDADKVVKAVEDKICEDEDFGAKAQSNSMSDLRTIFGDVVMKTLTAVLSDNHDMYEKSDEYMRIMNGGLLPIVYRRCNAEGE